MVILADEITGKTLSKNAWGLDYCNHNGSIIDLTNEAFEPALLDQEEDLNRLLYVALTRAKHAVFLGVPNTGSTLHRLLHDRDIKSLGPIINTLRFRRSMTLFNHSKCRYDTLIFATTAPSIMVFQEFLGIDQAR